MIKNIEIQNFKSIQHVKIDLKPLTVIVGANSTGKSNLIKALDFISDLIDLGVDQAINKQGGFDEILPKQYRILRGHEVYFKISMDLTQPDDWPTEYGTLGAEYEIGFKKNNRGNITITRERLLLNSIFLIGDFFYRKETKEEAVPLSASEIQNYSEVYGELIRKNGKVNFSTNADFNDKHSFKLILYWLGLFSFFSGDESIQNRAYFKMFMSRIFNEKKQGIRDESVRLMLSYDSLIIGFSSHLRKIANDLESIARYDLFINELRKEQAASKHFRVSPAGDNVPSVVKRFVKEKEIEWKRILTTMSNISPYFANVYSDSLKAGKEYILFHEIFSGREVESWDASDGTLRALAILLSLESHATGSAILIEEPEHGLHPWAIKDLISHIRNTIEARNLQVILTTHSQQVLECILPNEILITERDENGTHYNKIPPSLSEKINIGEIGSLWTKGLLKGVPTSI